MYGATTTFTDFEEYVSLHQLNDMDKEQEKIGYCNVAGCVLVFTTVYGVIVYLVFYVL